MEKTFNAEHSVEVVSKFNSGAPEGLLKIARRFNAGYGAVTTTPSVELFSDQPPLNLETLTASRPKTCSWIQAQEFDYAALDTAGVFRILCEMSGIKKSLLGYRAGTIIAHDCVEDDGPVVERKFHLHLTRSKDVLRLTINLENA